jgi:hypothetical protein
MNKPAYNKANLVGQKFGKLLVIRESEERKTPNQAYWLCKCDCGNEHTVSTNCLNMMTVKSCGRCKRIAWNSKRVGEISGLFWQHIITGAFSRNIEVLITPEQAWNKFIEQDRKCALSGVELRFSDNWRNPSDKTASLDRIDSSKNYTIDNIQWVHKTVNRIKSNIDQDEFISWCTLIAEKKRCQLISAQKMENQDLNGEMHQNAGPTHREIKPQ